MTQEFVTLPREVIERAIEALRGSETPTCRAQYDIEIDALADLSAALDQADFDAAHEMLEKDAGIHVSQQQQAEQPAMTPIAQRKLDSLLAEGYTISGYSVYHEQKHQHGFVTGAGLVGWWRPDGVEYPQPLSEQESVAWLTIEVMGPRTTVDVEWEDQLQKLPSGIYKLYTNPQPKSDASGKPDEWFDRLKAAHNIK